MGYYQVLGGCFACGRLFTFNPHRVPSFDGEPICEPCMVRVNRRRAELGQPEWVVLAGAYEPADEAEESL